MPNPFNSREHRPTESDLQVLLGDDRYGLWQMVARELGLISDLADVHWAGEEGGWAWRFMRGKSTLASLSPDGVSFTASFTVALDEQSRLVGMEQAVGQEAAALIRRSARKARQGMWVHWPVRQRGDAQTLVKSLRAKVQLGRP